MPMTLKGRGSVAEVLKYCLATDAVGYLDHPLDLRLDEEPCAITELAAPTEARLDNALDAAGIDLPLGRGLMHAGGRLMRLWPTRVWHIGADAPNIGLVCTSIGHGHCILRLRGPDALYFLADYASADLRAAPIRRAALLRCRIGSYDATLWWLNTRDLYVVVERCLAQSFVNHLRALVRRRNPHHVTE